VIDRDVRSRSGTRRQTHRTVAPDDDRDVTVGKRRWHPGRDWVATRRDRAHVMPSVDERPADCVRDSRSAAGAGHRIEEDGDAPHGGASSSLGRGRVERVTDETYHRHPCHVRRDASRPLHLPVFCGAE